MKRLFNAFSEGRLAVGLLLLRLVLGSSLVMPALARWGQPVDGAAVVAMMQLVLASGLAAGCWTPVVALIVTFVALGAALVDIGMLASDLEQAALALCVVLLGPGALSIDARLFGRRRVDVDNFRAS